MAEITKSPPPTPPHLASANHQEENDVSKLKIIIQTLSKELEDQKQKSKSTDWLLKQNKECENKIKKLEIQIYHWKNSANDAMDRLSRISQEQGPKTSADIFYDQANQRILENFAYENQLLVKKWEEYSKSSSPVDLLKKIESLEQTNQFLKVQLELKFKENQSLKKTLNTNDGNLVVEVDKRQMKISQLNQDLARLRVYLVQKHHVAEYVKSSFENIKDDIMKRFTKCYQDDKENFMHQLETTSNDDLPKFLTDPILLDAATSTDVSMADAETFVDFTSLRVPHTKIDERYDSGIGTSVTENERKLLEEIRQQQESITGFQDKIKMKDVSENELKEKLSNTHEELDYHKRMLSESENELASWKTALTQSQEETRQFRKDNDELQDKIKTLEVQKLNLEKQVPFHVSTVNLLRENEELKDTVKTLEAVNRNLNHIIHSRKQQRRTPGNVQRAVSADTQIGQERPSEYPRPPNQNQEYMRMMHMQRTPVLEPWQTTNWSSPIRHSAIAADGPTHVRDSLPPTNPQKKPESLITQQERKAEIAVPGRSSPVESTSGESADRPLEDNMSQCRTCGKKYPSSLIWDHIKICMHETDD